MKSGSNGENVLSLSATEFLSSLKGFAASALAMAD